MPQFAAIRTRLIVEKVVFFEKNYKGEDSVNMVFKPLDQIRHAMNKDSFEEQLLGSIAAASVDADSGIEMMKIDSYKVDTPANGDPKRLAYDCVMTAMGDLQNLMSNNVFGLSVRANKNDHSGWSDQNKLRKNVSLTSCFETDIYAAFRGGCFEAGDLLGHCVTKFAAPEGQADWKLIDMDGKMLWLEVTTDPRVLRHKVYQLARSILVTPICNDPISVEDIGLLAVSVNGSEQDFDNYSSAIVSHWGNLWAASPNDSNHLAAVKQRMLQTPFIIIWTQRRNLFHSLEMAFKDILRLQQSVDFLKFLHFLHFLAFLVLVAAFVHTSNKFDDKLDALSNKFDEKFDQVLAEFSTPLWKRLIRRN